MNTPRLKGTVVIATALLAWLTVPADAANVNVDCTGSNHQAFQSINDALKTLDLVGPNSITVVGTCHENVALFQRDRLTIQALAGRYATIENAANPPAPTLSIGGSHNIVLDHLIIQGGAPALKVSEASSAIFLQNSTVEESIADGIIINMSSTVHMENSTVRNNSGCGIFMVNESQLLLGTYPTQRIRITGNGFGGGGNGTDGINIDGANVQLNFGVLTVSGNHGAGIRMEGGRLQFYGGEADSPGVIENNNTGLLIGDAASVTLWSAFSIGNNGTTGISVGGSSSITFFASIDSKGKNAVTSIYGHSTVGLTLGTSSAAQIYGPHVIHHNGSTNADPGSRAGISLAGSSLTIGGGTSVSNNVGPGIRMILKSDLVMWDTTVSYNTEEGIRETNLSGGSLWTPLTFNGNGGSSLYCDNFSVAFGNAISSLHGVNCPNITHN